MKKCIDLSGKKFGKLLVCNRCSDYIQPNGQHKVMYECLCDCGNTVVTRADYIKNGHTQSCGCLQGINLRKHGKGNTRIYEIWCNIKTRCYNKSNKRYLDYGGRGITVCDEWLHDFQAFYDWSMANGYRDDLTIDRIDNNKGYLPDNCRWVTQKEQQNNRRNNHLITYNGKTQTLAQWADEIGLSYKTIQSRIKRGWNIEKALNTL